MLTDVVICTAIAKLGGDRQLLLSGTIVRPVV